MSDTLILGIDFGTTNTVISYYDKGTKILKDGLNSLIPSKIYTDIESNKSYFGNYIPMGISSSEIISGFKINGKDCNSSLGNRKYIEMFFTYLFTLVNEKLMKKNNYSDVKSVLSVPSNFNDNDRKIIMQIGNNVGFNIIRLINSACQNSLLKSWINF